MDRTELRKRWIMGTVQPELFYIPWGHKKTGSIIYINVVDTEGNPVNVTGLTLSYYTYTLYHNIERDETGDYTVVVDETNKGYAFNQDTEWRYPVPLPSQWEILPLPDFRISRPHIEGAEETNIYQLRATYTFPARNLIEITNIYQGAYSISVQQPPNILSMSYAPDYYNNYDSDHPVDRSSYQIDKNGQFSGFSFKTLYNPQYGYPNGYDFYCLTDKFRNNTLDVVCTRVPVVRYVITWIDVDNYTGRQFEAFGDTLITHRYNWYIGIGVQRGNYIGYVGKVLAVKLYVNGQYKGCMSVDFFTLRHNFKYEITTEQVTTQGLPDIQRVSSNQTDFMVADLAIGGVYYPYNVYGSYVDRYQIVYKEVNYKGSFYNDITKEMEEESGWWGYTPGTVIYSKNDCSTSESSESTPNQDANHEGICQSISRTDTTTVTGVQKIYSDYNPLNNRIRVDCSVRIDYEYKFFDIERKGGDTYHKGDTYIGSFHSDNETFFDSTFINLGGGRYIGTIPWTGSESAYEYTGDDATSYYYTDGITPSEMFSYFRYLQYDTTTVEFED